MKFMKIGNRLYISESSEICLRIDGRNGVYRVDRLGKSEFTWEALDCGEGFSSVAKATSFARTWLREAVGKEPPTPRVIYDLAILWMTLISDWELFPGQPPPYTRGLDSKHAREHAVTNDASYIEIATDDAGLLKIFNTVRPRDILWISFTGEKRTSKEYEQFKVGRRSYSKKYGVTTLALMKHHETKAPPAHKRFVLRDHGKGNVQLAYGNLAMTLHGIYLPWTWDERK